MNELIQYKSWFNRNWKWLVSIIVILIFIVVLMANSTVGDKIAGIAKIHTESYLYKDALEIAKKDENVIAVLGELQPLGKLAIIEGSHKYLNNYNRIELSVTVIGSKAGDKIRSKMDILADRNGDEWIYKYIHIRIIKPEELKQIIEVVKLSEY